MIVQISSTKWRFIMNINFKKIALTTLKYTAVAVVGVVAFHVVRNWGEIVEEWNAPLPDEVIDSINDVLGNK